MKNKFCIFIFFAGFLFVAFSCKKQDKCVGGAGGNLILKVTLQHHEHIVINLKNNRDTVYIKYNAQEYAGSNPTDYDATVIGEYGLDYVLLPNLKCGDYYLFAVGVDPIHYDRVTGGIPYSTEQSEGEVSVTIPVTE